MIFDKCVCVYVMKTVRGASFLYFRIVSVRLIIIIVYGINVNNYPAMFLRHKSRLMTHSVTIHIRNNSFPRVGLVKN